MCQKKCLVTNHKKNRKQKQNELIKLVVEVVVVVATAAAAAVVGEVGEEGIDMTAEMLRGGEGGVEVEAAIVEIEEKVMMMIEVGIMIKVV